MPQSSANAYKLLVVVLVSFVLGLVWLLNTMEFVQPYKLAIQQLKMPCVVIMQPIINSTNILMLSYCKYHTKN